MDLHVTELEDVKFLIAKRSKARPDICLTSKMISQVSTKCLLYVLKIAKYCQVCQSPKILTPNYKLKCK